MTELHALRDTYRSDKAALLAAMQATGASTRGIRVLLRKLSTLAGQLLQTREVVASVALEGTQAFGFDTVSQVGKRLIAQPE